MGFFICTFPIQTASGPLPAATELLLFRHFTTPGTGRTTTLNNPIHDYPMTLIYRLVKPVKPWKKVVRI